MQPHPRGPSDVNEHAEPIDQKMDEYWNRLIGFMCRPKTLLAVVLVVFVVTRLWLLLAFKATWPDTAYNYSQYARMAIDCRLAPYRDVRMEYPPAAWWLMAVPRLIDSTTYSDWAAPPQVVKQFFDWYFTWFHLEIFLADTFCLGLMLAIGRKMLPAAQWVLPGAYTLLTACQPRLIYDRLDIVLLLLFLLCIVCWLTSESSLRVGASGSKTVEPRSLEDSANRWGEPWRVASYLFLGLGISFKIMPVIFVPFLLLADVWAAGAAWRLAGRIFALAVGAAGPFLVYIPSAGWNVFSLFQYHGGRGIHLESIWGSLMLAAAAWGVPCQVVDSHTTYDVTGAWSSALRIVLSVCLVTIAASFGLWTILRGRRFEPRLALDCAILVLANSTVLAHVFSPQYLNWLLPLALLLALNIFPRSWAIWCGFGALVVAIAGISSWLYPYHYLAYIRLETLPVILAVTRSACLVGLALLLNVSFFARYGLVPRRVDKLATGTPAKAG